MAQGVPKKTGWQDHTTVNPTVNKPLPNEHEDINDLLTKLSDNNLRKQ